MKQNKYDDPAFFDKYSQMPRSVHGLAGAGEWKTLEKMLPDFNGKRVLDLGCGYGWHCQYALAHGAAAVVGVDISTKMLDVAREKTPEKIAYICAPIEDAEFPPDAFEVVISSLAFHYVEDFVGVARKVFSWLTGRGAFVFSVEHPVFTAQGTQDWVRDTDGNILHFPVDHYFFEGARETNFLGEKVTKYHRTLTTYVNTLLQTGFDITGVVEPQPPKAMLEIYEGMKDDLRRPMMLILSAHKRA